MTSSQISIVGNHYCDFKIFTLVLYLDPVCGLVVPEHSAASKHTKPLCLLWFFSNALYMLSQEMSAQKCVVGVLFGNRSKMLLLTLMTNL